MSTAMPEPLDTADDSDGIEGPRILVVDADDRTRQSIVGILGIRHRFDVVGSTSQVAEAIALVRSAQPDVVIVDPRLPDVADGLALIRRIRSMGPATAILAVGWSPDLEDQVIDAGADGFVRKTFKPGDLSNGIARCMDGRSLPIRSAGDAAAAPAPTPLALVAMPVDQA